MRFHRDPSLPPGGSLSSREIDRLDRQVCQAAASIRKEVEKFKDDNAYLDPGNDRIVVEFRYQSGRVRTTRLRISVPLSRAFLDSPRAIRGYIKDELRKSYSDTYPDLENEIK